MADEMAFFDGACAGYGKLVSSACLMRNPCVDFLPSYAIIVAGMKAFAEIM